MHHTMMSRNIFQNSIVVELKYLKRWRLQHVTAHNQSPSSETTPPKASAANALSAAAGRGARYDALLEVVCKRERQLQHAMAACSTRSHNGVASQCS